MTLSPLERDVQRQVVDVLKALGATVYATSQYRASRITPGIPDLYALHPKLGGVWVEVKSATGKQSPEQEEFQADCERSCVEYWIIRSTDELRERLTDAGVLRE